jgi:predicted RNA-binding protein with PIN domain
MDEYLIVDGYNIIGAWPELRELKNINLEQARDRLIEILADYQAYSGYKTILVFDAHQVPGLGGKYEQNKLNILYTKEKETADECIERLVKEKSGRRTRVIVATSDFVEQHVIFGAGALRRSARELLLDVQESHGEIQKRIVYKGKKAGNTFDSKLNDELKDVLEKWRRGKP